MRQVISTAVVAVIVGALAGATMSAVAQAPAEQAITPAAGINAASVDGKSAVGYTNNKRARRGKLVATNRAGELPPNIVRPFWGYVKNKPGILADDQISWNEVVGTPAGFADGVDNEGVTGLKVTKFEGSGYVGPNTAASAYSPACPSGSVVIGGGHWVQYNGVYNEVSGPTTDGKWWVAAQNTNAAQGSDIKAYVYCLSTEPAGNVTTAGKLSTAAAPKRAK